MIIAAPAWVAACSHTNDPIAVGTVERHRIELSATYSEPITAHHVREGDHIAAGTLVTEQSPIRAAAQLASRQATRNQLAARLAELTRGPRQESIREAIARLDGADAIRRDAELELKRIDDLMAKGFATVAQRDQLAAQRDSAVASQAAAQASLDSMVAGTTAEELAQARFALAAAESQVAEAAENASRLRHLAPLASLVESLPYRIGETPPIGAPVAVLLTAGAPFARVYVPEPLRARVHAGDTVAVAVDGVDAPFTGRVRFIATDASFTPYFALTRYDRGRLVYVAEIDLVDADDLPAGVPLEARFTDE
ncbi:MAG: HlyD family efflux transporter periplasmic adaptor subunit [Gammaproteobacteria bacterium]|nr:HlyD family efflux transporter periplasmic adaptor subunit [Gammaproteobacteria bacterium]